MTATRLVSCVALPVVVGAVTIVLLAGGEQPYRISAEMVDAGQLVEGNRVRIEGADAGRVSGIELTGSGRALVSLELDPAAGPLPEGTSLTVRLTSQTGSASRYVVLTPGDPSGPDIPNGGSIESIHATSPVDFDAFIDTLDIPTREGLRSFIAGGAQHYGSRAAASRKALRRSAPALATSAAVLEQLAKDRRALNRLIARGAIAAQATASRASELTRLVTHANATAGAVADESVALQQSLARLPPTLRAGERTLADVRPALGDLESLVETSKPATRRLEHFLRRLRPLLARSVPTLGDLSRMISEDGADNDLVDLTRALPALQRLSAGANPRSIRTMDRTQDMVDAYREYTPDIAAAVARFAQVSSYYDANGHYIRTQPSLFAYGLDELRNELTPLPGDDRLAGLQTGMGARCPGGAPGSPPADGSAPRPVAGCKVPTR